MLKDLFPRGCCFPGKKISLFPHLLSTQAVCFPPHVTQLIYNRSLTLLYAKANGFMIEEELSHEGTVQKHIKNWGKLKYRKGHYELSTLHVQNKASLHISKQYPCYSTGFWGTSFISVPAPRETFLHDTDTTGGEASTKCPPGPAHWRLVSRRLSE